MKLIFCSVGKAHDPLFAPAITHFTQRLSHYFPVEWKLIAPPKNAAALDTEMLKSAEAKAILDLIDAAQTVILLDELGTQISSPGLAQKMQHYQNLGTKTCVFIIAGAFGAAETLKKRANFIWSLGPMVYPHMLVRLILAEQVYRAGTILKNEKYHHA